MVTAPYTMRSRVSSPGHYFGLLPWSAYPSPTLPILKALSPSLPELALHQLQPLEYTRTPSQGLLYRDQANSVVLLVPCYCSIGYLVFLVLISAPPSQSQGLGKAAHFASALSSLPHDPDTICGQQIHHKHTAYRRTGAALSP